MRKAQPVATAPLTAALRPAVRWLPLLWNVVPALVVCGSPGCNESDVGLACPELLGDTGLPAGGDGTGNTTEWLEVVEQRVSFPCASLVCISTVGHPGYCSRRCRNDAGCPPGFSCRTIQPIGPFADEQFCAFKECLTDEDCGDIERLECAIVPGAHPAPDIVVSICAFKELS